IDQEDWKAVGYVVREALDAAHLAMEKGDTKSVSLAWVRYITHWTRSGPGLYCGVEVVKRGFWPNRKLGMGEAQQEYYETWI
uniref:Uncharacterized protein n=1 Tax=Amphimedon queenslandica TaxID=400682 RepID=A0A1X7TQ97_AMPQE